MEFINKGISKLLAAISVRNMQDVLLQEKKREVISDVFDLFRLFFSSYNSWFTHSFFSQPVLTLQ